MRFTLISPRIAIQKGDFLGSGIPYWPVELAVFAAFLTKQQESVQVIDLFGEGIRTLEDGGDHYLQGLPLASQEFNVRVQQADCFVLYAISSMSHAELLQIIKLLRRWRSDRFIAVLENSQAVTAYSVTEKTLDFFEAGADALICGEPYWNWHEIREYMSTRDQNKLPSNVVVPSAASRPVKRVIRKDGSYPVPAWELFNYRAYWSLPYSHGPKTKTYFPMLTSRGCPYPCDFCVVPETNETTWRPRKVEEVVEEMIALRDRFGVHDFQLEDLNPTINPKRTEAICDLLIARKADIRFYIVSGTKAETVKLSQLDKLAAAGCRYISISPESGSNDVLKAMRKPFDYAHGIELVKASRKRGIYTQACFLTGHPSETPEAHELSKQYLRQLVQAGIDEVVISVVAPLPGSQMVHDGKVQLEDKDKLISFSPKGRAGWAIASQRRGELIRTYFLERLTRRPFAVLFQGMRALFYRPRTKMENLPARIAFVYWQVLKSRLRHLGIERRTEALQGAK